MINRVQAEINGKMLTIETGELAKQASGSVLVKYGQTVILAAVTVSPEPKDGIDYVPLMVDYRERTYSAGKIPGGFFKREGRSREKEILTSRLIDRSIRPLINKDFHNDIQVAVTVLSFDNENDADIPALIGASCAIGISQVYQIETIAAVRIVKVNDNYIVNPTFAEQAGSKLNLVISATADSILMMEGEAKEALENEVLEAIRLAHDKIKEIIGLEESIIKPNSKPKLTINKVKLDEQKKAEIKKLYYDRIKGVLCVEEKIHREESMAVLCKELIEKYTDKAVPSEASRLKEFLDELTRTCLRRMIIEDGKREVRRGIDEIRPISGSVGILPRTHGSAIFTRGQTQALVTVTLGTKMDSQIIDGLEEEYKKKFMLHYNFPSYSTGEVKPDRGPGRREIGHGALAERAIKAVLPEEDNFPYIIRIVSDILESNGSSSMASVCGGSLALMDAGINISAPVGGVSIGLIKDPDKTVILTDIDGAEDHYGDLDFKAAGTLKGITAIQMDMKVNGLDMGIMSEILARSKSGREKVLHEMEKIMKLPRKEISPLAPKIITLKVPVEKIREIIGPGGKIIKKIIFDTSADMQVEDDGTVTISADNMQAAEAARKMVEEIIADVEVGKIYKGKVMRIMNFGAFVEVLPGKEGLVHISHLAEKRVNKVEDVVSEGDELLVKCIEIDSQGRINLSHKEAIKSKSEKPK